MGTICNIMSQKLRKLSCDIYLMFIHSTKTYFLLNLFVYLSICLYLSAYMYVYLFVYVCLSAYVCQFLSTCLTNYIFLCLYFIICLPLCPVSLSVYFSIATNHK